MISTFRNDYEFLSNFYTGYPVEYNGIVYSSGEAAFQAQKCPKRAKEFYSLGPSEAKKLGRSVELRLDWEEVKDQIMLEVVRAKFGNDEVMARWLLATGDEELIEGNTWNDTYWGVCKGKGKNKLGQILMQVREELKNGKL